MGRLPLRGEMHPALAQYTATEFFARATFDVQRETYVAPYQGRMVVHCGLIAKVRARHYLNYRSGKERKSRRGRTNIKGSSCNLGMRVDRELVAFVAQKKNQPLRHPLTAALLRYWFGCGHRLVAAQLPVRVKSFACCMTQADIITMDSVGRLWLWEVKTGAPIGFFRKDAPLQNVRGEPVPCTGLAVWQLQLAYTRRALIDSAMLPIAEARIIQVHEQRKGPVVTKVYELPEWHDRIIWPM